MAFNTQKFLETKFTPRTADVKVPDLKDFFGKGDKPVWKVRGLTGKELGRANETADRNKNIQAILEGLVSGRSKEKTEAVKEMLGNLETDTPQDIAKRLEHLVLGSVDPECDLDLALKLCTSFPIEFYELTNKVLELTGKGHVPGLPKASGKKKA